MSTSNNKSRPSPHSSKSFTRYEPSTSAGPVEGRSRATTVTSPVTARKSLEEDRDDVFTRKHEDDTDAPTIAIARSQSLPDRFDELPVELASLTDRFIESLSSPSFSGPPTIDQISELFQSFYTTAADRISTHITTLRLKLERDGSTLTRGGARPVGAKKSSDSLRGTNQDANQQMLTASEVAEKRQQRRSLDYKKVLLEEAVEKRACESIYGKIWQHKSTLDEIKDEKLRSKTAALALVGISLRDLGITDGKTGKTVEDIQQALGPARDGLMKMSEERYPLGKLEHLTAAHKVIVETLADIHGSSSSADEILPTLIYTLITAPVEGVDAISNLNFIQRFRYADKIDGEAAYCLTNLEAAIGFLEDVDLTTLRADERAEGPQRIPSGALTPSLEMLEPFPSLGNPTTSVDPTAATGMATPAKNKSVQALAATQDPPSPRHQRTLSDLLRPVQNANDAVRASAKEGIDHLTNTLDNSLKMFVTRLKDHLPDSTKHDSINLPQTLDQARALVSKPVTPEAPEDSVTISETSSLADTGGSSEVPGMVSKPSPAQATRAPVEDKVLALFGGKRSNATTAVAASSQNLTRERSNDRDSIRSNSSANKKVSFAASDAPKASTLTTTPGNPLDAVKSLASSNLNPLNHVGSAFGAFKSFARPVLVSPPPSTVNVPKRDRSVTSPMTDGASSSRTSTNSHTTSLEKQLEPEIDRTMMALKIRRAKPPIKEFMDIRKADELKLKDVQTLLDDYQRLARLLHDLANEDNDRNT